MKIEIREILEVINKTIDKLKNIENEVSFLYFMDMMIFLFMGGITESPKIEKYCILMAAFILLLIFVKFVSFLIRTRALRKMDLERFQNIDE